MGTPVENKTAVIFEADDGTVTKTTYKELLARVSQFANALKADGVKKGDRVLVYMPMTLEGVIAMQACARIGATHSVVFGGFSAKALQERIIDAGATAVITANFQMRGGKELPLKSIVDDALALGGCESIRNMFVFMRTSTPCNMVAGRDISFAEALKGQKSECKPAMVSAEHRTRVLGYIAKGLAEGARIVAARPVVPESSDQSPHRTTAVSESWKLVCRRNGTEMGTS